MKKYITIQLIFLFMYAGSLISAPELWIQNYSSRMINGVLTPRTIIVKIYPVSMVFNGLWDYNLLALNRKTNEIRNFFYITGVGDSDEVKRTHYVLSPIIGYHELKINHDNDFSGNNGNDITVGFGRYRVDVWWDAVFGEDPPDDYFTIEYSPVVGLVTNN